MSIHETTVELEYGMNSEKLANASINPKYRTIRHWYDAWKLINLGTSTEVGVLQVFITHQLYLYDISLYVLKYFKANNESEILKLVQ